MRPTRTIPDEMMGSMTPSKNFEKPFQDVFKTLFRLPPFRTVPETPFTAAIAPKPAVSAFQPERSNLM